MTVLTRRRQLFLQAGLFCRTGQLSHQATDPESVQHGRRLDVLELSLLASNLD